MSLVAVVSHLPVGTGKITEAELRRGLAQQVAATGRPAPGPESGKYAKLQLLTTRIQERVVRAVRGPRAELEAFEAFVDAYVERWRARTVCAPRVAIDRCSNGPLPAT